MAKIRIRGFRRFAWTNNAGDTKRDLIFFGKGLSPVTHVKAQFKNSDGGNVGGQFSSSTLIISNNGRTGIARNIEVIPPDDVTELEVTVEHVNNAGEVEDSDFTTDDA